MTTEAAMREARDALIGLEIPWDERGNVFRLREQEVTAILTALSSAGIDCEGWRDIESAPKDGTKILIFNHNWDFAPVAKWVAHDGVDDDDNGITFGGWGLDEFVSIPGACEEGFLGWNEDKEGNVMPTHWAALPPLASGRGDKQ